MKINQLLSKIRSSRRGQEIARAILSTKLIYNNPLYKKMYNKKINSVMKAKEKNLPSTIDIGITNACNADCIMCPHNKLKKFGFMDMKLYEKIIDDASSEGIKNVTLTFFGEAMLDVKLNERVKYAKSKGLHVSFFTNASLMDEEKARGIIEAGLDNIIISLDSDKKEVYEKIRRNLKFSDTKKNILKLLELKKTLNKKNPSVNLVFVLMNENASELKSFYEKWMPKVDGINVINMRNWAGAIDKKTKHSLHFKKIIERTPCALLWNGFVVDWDGEVVICCDDYSHKVVIGDLNKESIRDVWEGKKLKAIREMHKRKEFSKIPICSQCNKKTVWWQM